MLQAQEIYGPGVPAVVVEGGLALGRRLFRTVPEDQFDRGPATSVSGRWTMVADIRLDNRSDLCTALGLEDEAAASLADSSILLAALDRWSEAALDRAVGDFALAAWDRAHDRLLLARDALGRRPLHYHRGNSFFAFASMPKGLLGLPEVPSAPNPAAAARLLALMPESGPDTFFEGIERVMPGNFCHILPGSVATRQYWNPSPAPLRLKSPEDYAEAVREQFDRAVEARLRTNRVPIGTELSGGLDSSAVTATAARLLPGGTRLPAFTAVPREGFDGRVPTGRIADEGPLAAKLASLYPNIDHVLVRTEGKSPLDALDRNFFLFDRPFLNLCTGAVGSAIMEAAKRRKIGVLLVGTLGNLSASYSGFEALPQLLARGRMVSLMRNLLALYRGGTRAASLLSHTMGPFLSQRLWIAINRRFGRFYELSDYSAVNPQCLVELSTEAAASGLDFSYRPRRDPFDTRLWAIRRVDPGNYVKGNLAGWGVDVRDPTADRRLVELCLSIPPEEFLRGGKPRAIARRAFTNRLPEAIREESRSGVIGADWYEGLAPAREQVEAEIQRLAAAPGTPAVIDVERLKRLGHAWPSEGWDSAKVQSSYRYAMLRSISVGHFMRKASGSNG